MSKPLYDYEEDLDTFFRELSKPAGQENVPFTMNDVGGNLFVAKSIGNSVVQDFYVVDMEGRRYEKKEFDAEQLGLLHQYQIDGKHYAFLGYPDIPASVMRVLGTYAKLHPEPSTRIQLWKLGRSGIRNPYVMDICCCILEEGVNLADVMVVKDNYSTLLRLRKEQADLLESEQDYIILECFCNAERCKRKPVVDFVKSLGNKK